MFFSFKLATLKVIFYFDDKRSDSPFENFYNEKQVSKLLKSFPLQKKSCFNASAGFIHFEGST